MLDLSIVCEECQRIEHASYCSKKHQPDWDLEDQPERDIRDCGTWDCAGSPCGTCLRCQSTEEVTETDTTLMLNCEGLSFGEWCTAAFTNLHDDTAELYQAWISGEDPTEWRNK